MLQKHLVSEGLPRGLLVKLDSVVLAHHKLAQHRRRREGATSRWYCHQTCWSHQNQERISQSLRGALEQNTRPRERQVQASCQTTSLLCLSRLHAACEKGHGTKDQRGNPSGWRYKRPLRGLFDVIRNDMLLETSSPQLRDYFVIGGGRDSRIEGSSIKSEKASMVADQWQGLC